MIEWMWFGSGCECGGASVLTLFGTTGARWTICKQTVFGVKRFHKGEYTERSMTTVRVREAGVLRRTSQVGDYLRKGDNR